MNEQLNSNNTKV